MKRILTLTLALLLVLGTVACATGANSLVGNWEFSYMTYNGQVVLEAGDSDTFNLSLALRRDGTCTLTSNAYETPVECTWSYAAPTLTVVAADGNATFTYYPNQTILVSAADSTTGSTMTLKRAK